MRVPQGTRKAVSALARPLVLRRVPHRQVARHGPSLCLGLSHHRRWNATASNTTETTGDRVLVEKGADGIALVTLNRPDKLNALDLDMFHAIADTAERIAGDRSIRAVVLRGSGRGFCAGLDVKSMALKSLTSGTALHNELLGRPATDVANLVQRVGYAWRRVPVPVLACLHGVCLGGGLQIALGADFRFCTPDCRLAVMEAKWGLIPDMSATVTLREVTSIDTAKELTMTARVFSGTEAKAYGIISHLSDNPVADATKLAKEIAERSPDSVAAAKRLYQDTWVASEADALKTETEVQLDLLGGWNMAVSAAKGLGSPVVPGYKKRQ